MPRQHTHRRNGLEIPLLLQVLQLPRQHDDEGDLHDLHRLQVHGEIFDAQPRAIAGAAVHAQGRFQQQDQHKAAAQQPLPVLADLVQIQHAHEDVGHDAQSQRRDLYDDVFIGVGVAGGAGDHQAAEKGRAGAERQQHQIHLPDPAREKIQYLSHLYDPPFRKTADFASSSNTIPRYSLPQEVFSVNAPFSLFFCFFPCYNKVI